MASVYTATWFGGSASANYMARWFGGISVGPTPTPYFTTLVYLATPAQDSVSLALNSQSTVFVEDSQQGSVTISTAGVIP